MQVRAVSFEARQTRLRQISAGMVPDHLSIRRREDRALVALGLKEGEFSQTGYQQYLGPFVINLYEAVTNEEVVRRFPPDFWADCQGKSNLIILGRHVLEDICGLQMGAEGERVDAQLFPQNQGAFLERWVVGEDRTWNSFLAERKLLPGIRQCGLTQQGFFMLLWPRAFDLRKPAGQHLDPWWFRMRNEWKNSQKNEIDKAIAHTLECHYGLVMDRKTGTIDRRLFSEGGKDFLRVHSFASWRDLIEEAGIYAMIADVSEYQGGFLKAFRSIYDWAFDLSTEEGRHLHFWNVFSQASTLWVDHEDVIDAVRHEVLVHDKFTWAELPHKFTEDWIRSKGMKGLVQRYDLVSLFRLCFSEEIRTGKVKIENLDYTTGNYKRMDRRGRVQIGSTRYCFPKGVRNLLVRRIRDRRIGLFLVEEKYGKRKLVLKYALPEKSGEGWQSVSRSELRPITLNPAAV